MNDQLKKLIQIYFICSILGIILIIIRKYIINSEIYFLKKETFNDCDYWCLSHYILYFLLGFYAPKYWYISVIISILWEYTEYLITKYSDYIDFMGIRKYISYSGSKDIVTNTQGLLLGMLFHYVYK